MNSSTNSLFIKASDSYIVFNYKVVTCVDNCDSCDGNSCLDCKDGYEYINKSCQIKVLNYVF